MMFSTARSLKNPPAILVRIQQGGFLFGSEFVFHTLALAFTQTYQSRHDRNQVRGLYSNLAIHRYH